jgi:hypothetical protein
VFCRQAFHVLALGLHFLKRTLGGHSPGVIAIYARCRKINSQWGIER